MWMLILNWHDAPDRSVWTWLLIVSWFGLVDINGMPLIDWPTWMVTAMLICVSVLKATVLWALFIIAKTRKWSKIAVIGILILYSLACLTNGICFCIYGFGISHRLVAVLSQTNLQETKEFLPGLFENFIKLIFSARAGLFLLTSAVIWFAAKRIPSKFFTGGIVTISIFGILGLGFALNDMPKGKNLLSVSVRVTKIMIESIRERSAMKHLSDSLHPLPDAGSVRTTFDASTVVMVIGESASADHWSLYGYSLPTTPKIDALSDSLFIFKDVIGSSTTTAVNMENILTLREDDSADKWYTYPLLLDLFNHAGYKTWWLSNQEKNGMWGNSTSVMVSGANVVEYLGKENSEDAQTPDYDVILLRAFQEAINDTASHKMINLHLMGSHSQYKQRYPSDFSKFNADDERILHNQNWINESKLAKIAEYDNSILYTDYILSRVIKDVAASTSPAVFIYFSDHGESVYDKSDFIGRDRQHVAVPMIIYANSAYAKSNPEIIARLRLAESKRFSTSDIAQLLMSITGTSYSKYNPERDILSEKYRERVRYVDGEPWDK